MRFSKPSVPTYSHTITADQSPFKLQDTPILPKDEAPLAQEQSPPQFTDPNPHPVEGSLIHRPEGDELLLQDSTLQQIIQAALNHSPPSPSSNSAWSGLLNPILEALKSTQPYEQTWSAFMDLIAQRPDFVRLSIRQDFRELQRGLLELARKLTSSRPSPQDLLIMHLPNQGFYHGALQEKDTLLLFLYFSEENIGLCRIMCAEKRTDWIARFQILKDTLPSDPELDGPLMRN